MDSRIPKKIFSLLEKNHVVLFVQSNIWGAWLEGLLPTIHTWARPNSTLLPIIKSFFPQCQHCGYGPGNPHLYSHVCNHAADIKKRAHWRAITSQYGSRTSHWQYLQDDSCGDIYVIQEHTISFSFGLPHADQSKDEWNVWRKNAAKRLRKDFHLQATGNTRIKEFQGEMIGLVQIIPAEKVDKLRAEVVKRIRRGDVYELFRAAHAFQLALPPGFSIT